MDDRHGDSGGFVVVWRVWEFCALACRYCGYSREMIRPRLGADWNSAVAFGGVLSDVQQRTGRAVLVSWLGGEPLAWGRLPEIACIFRRELGLRLGVTTNGLPLESPRVRESLLEDYDQITISVDGPAPFHDWARGLAGAFFRIRKCVRQLRAEDPAGRLRRRVNTVLMRGNVASFGPFCEEMADWGFHELSYNPLGGNDRPAFHAAHRLLPEQVERFVHELPELRRRMAERGLLIRGGERYLDRLAATAAGRSIAIDDCRPGTEFLFVDAAGRISPCSFSSERYGISISEIDSAEKFLELPRRFRALRLLQRLPACDDCHATHVFDKFKGALGAAAATADQGVL